MSTTEAPTFVPPPTRLSLRSVVPVDHLQPVRLGLMFSYLLAYLLWLRLKGLPIDRISVAISVAIFLVCAFVGRSWRTWGILLVDCAFYIVMWLAYEKTRGAADDGFQVFGLFQVGPYPLQVESMRNIDRAMFFGHDPNTVLQDHFWERSVRWYDVVASATYMTHFVFPIIAMAVLWVLSHRQWVRFMKRFATLLGVGCLLFVLLPTAPPWMVASPKYPYQLFHELHRDAGRGFRHLGFKGFTNDYKIALSNGNGVAAMPSLHASFASSPLLHAVDPPDVGEGGPAAVPHHDAGLTGLPRRTLVIDGLVGWGITVGTFWFWNRMERRTRVARSHRARAALRAPAPAPAPAPVMP
jgi:hypothetical protein